jgi:hypothetical protein
LSEDQISVIRSIVVGNEHYTENSKTNDNQKEEVEKVIADDEKWNNLKPTLRSLGMVKESIPNLSDNEDEDENDDDYLSDEFSNTDFEDEDDEDDLDEGDDDEEPYSFESIRRKRNKRRKLRKLKRRLRAKSSDSNDLVKMNQQQNLESPAKIIIIDEKTKQDIPVIVLNDEKLNQSAIAADTCEKEIGWFFICIKNRFLIN